MAYHRHAVCVVIAAKNAEATIRRAIESALREECVAEIVVVDDGSSDATATISGDADDGSGRVQVIELDRNRGPSFARNQAIARSKAPLVAILDADDFFLAGRFKTMLDGDDWDLVADNIVFIDERSTNPAAPDVPVFEAAPRFLDLAGFIEGNISRRGASRGEIGFLKPVIRREFLVRHGLRYDESLRLGEDYDLYVRCLAKGARYKIVHGCGYGAVVRADSLSGKHRTEDLKQLYEADLAILASQRLPANAQAALRRHAEHLRGRYELRRFLDRKADIGLFGAGLKALANPGIMPAVAGGIAADKFEALRRRFGWQAEQPLPRYLLPASTIAQK
ncbi:glycosyltransferase family 2 protein [Manganibacter manganicus]|uniref:Glycosyl transferase family A n=1 Tax=Manganibacter manganicus TaxID=1873176 RepID=A0A1V8RM48_9HYPH|nr:glycosyltransferase family 2 protein [Pseudaminobacter manganicus]OQM74267.1 glycosyl transferase family A [Pseudaminobacter manganicus]